MDRLKFQVVSKSTGEVYRLQAYRTENGVRFSCTCRAAENGLPCKHRLSLLSGDVKGTIDTDPEHVRALKAMVAYSPIPAVLNIVAAAEEAVAEAQQDFRAAKKMLAATLMG